MLCNINRGFKSVPKIHRKEITYLISTFEKIRGFILFDIYYDRNGYNGLPATVFQKKPPS